MNRRTFELLLAICTTGVFCRLWLRVVIIFPYCVLSNGKKLQDFLDVDHRSRSTSFPSLFRTNFFHFCPPHYIPLFLPTKAMAYRASRTIIIERLGLTVPLIQAPMAGLATPALAAAVSNAGALGSIALGACANAADAARQIQSVRALTSRPFNVNVFTHCDPPLAAASTTTTDFTSRDTVSDAVAASPGEAAWLGALAPTFSEFDAAPPRALRTIYESFNGASPTAAEIRRVVIEARPAVVSFHFGLPHPDVVTALKSPPTPTTTTKQKGDAAALPLLLCTVTNVLEAEAAFQAGMDAVVAQGWEAGGHRGIFDAAPSIAPRDRGASVVDPVSPETETVLRYNYAASDPQLGTFALVRQLTSGWGKLPVIAAGGIMDGAGIRAALELGAVAAQLGTAFVACPESNADAAYRKLLLSARWTEESGRAAADGSSSPSYLPRLPPTATVMTHAISGRPARCLTNRFTALGQQLSASGVFPPAYPRAYDAGKALHKAASASGDFGFGAYWAGQGAPLARAVPAAELVALLRAEYVAAV
jgi:nitronate monooxygenase